MLSAIVEIKSMQSPQPMYAENAAIRPKGIGVTAFSADQRLKTVSIIIPARNEERVISSCLHALTTLDFPLTLLEVILVDNGSTDNTITIANSFARKLPLTVLQHPGSRISELRNFGASASRGEILAFLDADCLPKPDWVRQALRLSAHYHRAIIGSDYLIPAESSWIAEAWYNAHPLPDLAKVSYVPSGDLVVSRELFDELGGFNASIQTNEDCEFCLRARIRGIPIVASAIVAVTHSGTPQTVAAFFTKQKWHGTHVLRVFRQNARTMQNAKPLAFAFYMLACMLGIMLGIPVALLIRDPRLVAFAGVALLILPTLLALQMVSSNKRWRSLPPLIVLFLLYGIARATCLMNPRDW